MNAFAKGFAQKFPQILIVITLTIFWSCGEYRLADKDIFQKKIPVFNWYRPIDQVITTNDGFITKINHFTTNGDSLNCEIIGNKEELICKIGFDGKIIWQKKAEFTDIPTKIVQDNLGNFYDISYNYGTLLRKLNSNLNEIAKFDLKTDQFFKNGETLTSVTYLNDDLLLGFGQLRPRRISDYSYGSKKFVCLIDSKLGIQKTFTDDEETISTNFSTFFKTSNNELIGLIYLNQSNTKSQILIQKFDINLNKLDQKVLDITNNTYLSANNVTFSNDEINIIYFGNGILNLLNTNTKMESKTYNLGLSFAYNPTFVKNSKNELIFMESSGNGYSNIKKILRNGDNISTINIFECGFNLQNSFIDNANGKDLVYSLTNSSTYNKPIISVLNSINNKELNKNVVYQSQYSRNCSNSFY